MRIPPSKLNQENIFYCSLFKGQYGLGAKGDRQIDEMELKLP